MNSKTTLHFQTASNIARRFLILPLLAALLAGATAIKAQEVADTIQVKTRVVVHGCARERQTHWRAYFRS